MIKIDYKPEVCHECGQTKDYALAIDRGTIKILKQMARFIGQKGINVVHPRKEMEGTLLTSNEVGNLSRPRIHGLIAKIKGEPGNYCLTSKGASFLHGHAIPRVAIRSKATGHTTGYYLPDENPERMCTIHDFGADEPWWHGINYDIEGGRIIKNEQPSQGIAGL